MVRFAFHCLAVRFRRVAGSSPALFRLFFNISGCLQGSLSIAYIYKKKKKKSRCALLNDRKEMGRKIKESFYTGDREGSILRS